MKRLKGEGMLDTGYWMLKGFRFWNNIQIFAI